MNFVSFTDYGPTLPHSIVQVTEGSRVVLYTAKELASDLDASGRDRRTGVYTLPTVAAWFFLDAIGAEAVVVTDTGIDGQVAYTITAA